MYANRDTAVPVVPQRGLAALPILALCCLLFILLLIAATIVLALIPIYTQTAVATRSSTSSTRYATAQVSSALNDGTIDANSQTSLANSIATAQGLPSGSVTVKSGVVSSNGGRRKRRGLLARSDRQVTTKTLTFSYVYNLIICGGSCTTAVLLKVAITITQVTLTVGNTTIFITTLSITVTASTLTAGPTVASTSTTSSTSSSSTVAVTTPFMG